MKMLREDYNYLKQEIDKIDRVMLKKHIDNVRQAGMYNSFADRIAWDLSYMAGLTGYICNNLYVYLTDEHIKTALKKISKELNIL